MLETAEFDCQIWLLERQVWSATPTFSMGLSSSLSMLSLPCFSHSMLARIYQQYSKALQSNNEIESPMQCTAPLHQKSKMCPVITPVLFPCGYHPALLPAPYPRLRRVPVRLRYSVRLGYPKSIVRLCFACGWAQGYISDFAGYPRLYA